MATKEQIQAAAKSRLKTKDIAISGGMKVRVTELSRADYRALQARIWETDADGNLKEDDKGFLLPRDKSGDSINAEWIAATVTTSPGGESFTVEEILEWAPSLQKELADEARALNGATPASATAIAKN